MTQEKIGTQTKKKEDARPKVRIDARVEAEIWEEIEVLVKETGETKSKVINDLLGDRLKSRASSNSELSRLEKELDEKNEQIKSLLRQQENNQELALHESKERQLQLEIEKQQSLTVNDSKVENEKKRGWFRWFSS